MHLKIARTMLEEIRTDLNRSHEIAHERIGFVFFRGFGSVFVATDYEPLLDDEYEQPDGLVGAQYSNAAITRILSLNMHRQAAVFSIHDHGSTAAEFSSTDRRSMAGVAPAFFATSPGPHGGLVMNDERVSAFVWTSAQATPVQPAAISVVGRWLEKWSPYESA